MVQGMCRFVCCRGQYWRSSSGGPPISDNNRPTTSSPRGMSEPPPRESKKIGAFRSAIAAAGSSKTKFLDTFTGRRTGRRYISMRLPSETNLPAHVPRSLGRGESNVPAEKKFSEDLLQASSPQSQANREFNSMSSMYQYASINSGDLSNHRSAYPMPQQGFLHRPSDPGNSPSDNSLLSPQTSLRPSPSATLHTTANHDSNAPPSPSHISALHGTDTPHYRSLPYQVQPPLTATSPPLNPPLKQPSHQRFNVLSSSPKHQHYASHSSISIPLDAGSQPFVSTPLGETLNCASSFQTNPVDPTASQDVCNQPRPAVVSAATSGTSWMPVGRSTQSVHSSTQPTRESIATCPSGAGTLDARSSSNGGMNSSIVTASIENNPFSNMRSTGSGIPMAPGAASKSGHSAHSSHDLGWGGSSNYFAPGFALLAFSNHLPSQPSGITSKETSQTSQHRTACNSAENSSPKSSRLLAQFSAFGPTSPEISPPVTQPRQLHAPSTPTTMPQAAHASVSGAPAAARSPEFATPSGPSRGYSPESGVHAEFCTPQAPISPEQISILSEASLVPIDLRHTPQGQVTSAGEQQHPLAPVTESKPPAGPSARHRPNATLPSPADLLKILHSTSKSASPQPLEASRTRRSQSFPNAAPLMSYGVAEPASASQNTPVHTSSRSVGGLTPPVSLNLEMSTPESRPMLTPDQRHKFASFPTSTGFMGCVDNPVFSSEAHGGGNAVPPRLSISSARTHPGVYDRRTERVEPQAEYGAISDSADLGETSTGIAAAAKRVAAMREHEQQEQSCQKRRASKAEHKGIEKTGRRKKNLRQVATDEAAEMLFSTTESTVSVGSHDNIFSDNMNEARDADVPSPPMPHTLATKGTAHQPRAFPPLHRLPELKLQPSAAKQAAPAHAESKRAADDACVSKPSKSSGSQDASVALSEESTSKAAAGCSSRNVHSITVGLAGSTQNVSDASDSGQVQQTDPTERACSPAAAANAKASKSLRERPNSKTASIGNSQTGSQGLQGNSADTMATVGSRVLGRDDWCTAAFWLGNTATVTSCSSVSGSGALTFNHRKMQGYSHNKPESVGKEFVTSGGSHRYIPPDLPSTGNSKPTSKSGSTGVKSVSSGCADSLSVRIKPSSFRSNSPSKAATRSASPGVREGSDRVASTSISGAVKPSSADSAAVFGYATAPRSETQCSVDQAENRSSFCSAESGASTAESQYLDAMMSTTKSAFEIDFSSNEDAVSPGRSRPHSHSGMVSLNQHRKPAQHSTKDSQGTQGSRDGTISHGNSKSYDKGPTLRHIHAKRPCSFAIANEASGGSKAAKDEAEQHPQASNVTEASRANVDTYTPETMLPEEISETPEEEAFAPSAAFGHSPIPTCPSLPLASPETQPQIGEILGGRFLLRRIVGLTPSAIIYGANDLQEGSVPCSVRMPAPKTPLAASMIAMGRMQWLRGKLSHSEGATSLVRIRSMPNLLGHGIVVSTESLEASVRGRMNLISSGKARPFSNSELRSLARQLLNGLKFMHASGIVHGDITPDSLFFKSEEGAQIRFVDLGCGCFPTSDPKPSAASYCRTPKSARDASSLGSFWSATGALSYRGRDGNLQDTSAEVDTEAAAALCRAPEAFATPPIVSDKMDVWSVGCILYQMETGEPLGHEPQADACWPNVPDPGPSSPHYFSDTNSFWEETQYNVSRGHMRRSLGAFAAQQANISTEFSEELIYGALPGHANARRSRSTLRHTIGTPDSSGAAAALRAHMGNHSPAGRRLSGGAAVSNATDHAAGAGFTPAQTSATAARACAEMWDVDALVHVAEGPGTDPGPFDSVHRSLSGAATRSMDTLHSSSADKRSKHRRSTTAEAEQLIQLQVCEHVVIAAQKNASDQAHNLNASRSGNYAQHNPISSRELKKLSAPPSEAHSSRPRSPVSMFKVSTARPVARQSSFRQLGGPMSRTDPEPSYRGNDIERNRTASPQGAYPSLRPKRICETFGSIGNLQPPADFQRTAPRSSDHTKSSEGAEKRRSLLSAWKSSRWGGGNRATNSQTTVRSSDVPCARTWEPTGPLSEPITEQEDQGRSRGSQRGRSSNRWGVRSLSGARHTSVGHSSSLPPAMQSGDNLPGAAGDSFSNMLEGLETTVDLPLTISARESYNSLPSTQALTRRASLQSQSGMVAGMSSPLSGGLSGGLGSQRGVSSRPGSARAGGISCRPWLAQRLSKIQDRDFARFLGAVLECCFMSRPTADQALQHPWLSYGRPSDR